MKKLIVILSIFILLFGLNYVSAENEDASEPKLQLEVNLNELIYQANEELKLLINLNNNSQERIQLNFSSAQIYEIVVKDWQNEVLYRWSEDKVFAQVLKDISLAPEEKKTYEDNIDLSQFTAGVYFLEVEIKSLDKEFKPVEKIFFITPDL